MKRASNKPTQKRSSHTRLPKSEAKARSARTEASSGARPPRAPRSSSATRAAPAPRQQPGHDAAIAAPASVSVSFERGPHPGLVRARIIRRIRAMIEALQLHNQEVSFLLTDDKRIHRLNKTYRHKDRPTDVLAFAMHEGELAELAGGVLGDVIVSVPTARKQADERGVSVLEEVTMLLAHGLLHLLGWDHETAAEDRRMRAETERLCRAARAREGLELASGRAAKRASATAGARSKVGAKRGLSRNRPAAQRS